MFPPTPDQYKCGGSVPKEDDLFCAHPASLCFMSVATTKQPPEIETTVSILNDIVRHHFVWRDNPLQVWMPGPLRMDESFNICYVKGMARACTLLAVSQLCIMHGIDLKTVKPALWETMRSVECRLCYGGVGDRKRVAFMNACLLYTSDAADE